MIGKLRKVRPKWKLGTAGRLLEEKVRRC